MMMMMNLWSECLVILFARNKKKQRTPKYLLVVNVASATR